jgi:hypothetical protein
VIAIVRRALLRAVARRAWLGQWTPAFVLTLAATALALFYSLVPHWYDMERYWLAWLGDRILTGSFPHAAGSESPYDAGHPWMPVEWLYAVVVAWTRERHVFIVFALLNGLAGVAMLWWALGACIARRVPGTVAFLVSASCFWPTIQRYELRAEAFGNAFLAAVLQWGGDPVKRFALVPLFALWANVHPSFAFGLLVVALQTTQNVRRGDLAAAAALAGCVLATLCTPFGFGLWQHVWWMSHGWVARVVPEWQPLFAVAPSAILLLFVPFVSMLARRGIRTRPLLDWSLWPIASVLALASQRFLALATGAGAPLACGLFRQRDIAVPRPVVWLALAAVVAVVAQGWPRDVVQAAGDGARDVDFGLLLTRASPPVVERGVDLSGKLVSCVPGWYCNAALYLGARTLYDGRTEPFSAQRVRELSESLTDPSILRKWPVDYAIVPPANAEMLQAHGSWREVARSRLMVIFQRRS